MFYSEHGVPHFHAVYGGDKVSIAVVGANVLEGGLPPRALRLVLEWARLVSRAAQSRLSRIVSMPVYQSMTIRNWNTTRKLAGMLRA